METSGIDLLKISYDRIIETKTVDLNDGNYQQYGYSKDETGYYLFDDELQEKIYYKQHDIDIKKHYEHILPSPSKFSPTYSDVDKQGSGRSEADGMMSRERIGHYQAFDVTWDIIPNSNEGINLARILKALPPSFTLEYHDIDGTANDTKTGTFYRGDINYDLYLFLKDRQVWRGIATTFVQFDVTPYDDAIEPTLL